MLGNRGRVFAYPYPCDMRKSFNTLSGLVLEMGHDLVTGDTFAFVSKNRKRAKVLWYDGTGLCLLAKRLDEGLFARLWEADGVLELSMSELSLLIEGCDVLRRLPLSPKVTDPKKKGRISKKMFK